MPGSAQINPLCERVENEVHALLLGDLVDHRRQLAVELALDLLRQLLDFLLRVFGEPLQIALLPFDVRLELRARRIAQHAAALIELLLVALQRLVLLLQLARLLFLNHLDLLGEPLCLQPIQRPPPAR